MFLTRAAYEFLNAPIHSPVSYPTLKIMSGTTVASASAGQWLRGGGGDSCDTKFREVLPLLFCKLPAPWGPHSPSSSPVSVYLTCIYSIILPSTYCRPNTVADETEREQGHAEQGKECHLK